MNRAAAFFDLDKTLIEGSSAIHFARASYRRGLVTRRQLAKDLWDNIHFRLAGSTDEKTDALRQRVLDAIAGRPVVELARLGPEVLAGVLPRAYPEMLEVAWGQATLNPTAVYESKKVALPVWVKPPDPPKPPAPPAPAPVPQPAS